MAVNKGQWFFGDEWDFILERGLHHPALGLFVPHNEHWSTLPILAYRPLLVLFGLRHYEPFAAAVVLLHLWTCHLLWRVTQRTRLHWTVGLGGTALFVLLGAGSENLLWAFQTGFVGSVAFGWCAALLATHERWAKSRVLLSWAASTCALLCSGVGVTMLVVTGVAVLLVSGVRRALIATLPPGLVFVVWYGLVGHDVQAATSHPGPRLLAHYVLVGIDNTLGSLAGRPSAGPLVLMLLAVGLALLFPQEQRRAALAYAGLVGLLFQFLLAGYGRAGFGLDQARASRYVYVGGALALPALLLVVDRALLRLPRPALPAGAAAFALLGVAALVVNVGQLVDTSHAERDREQSIKRQVLAAESLVGTGEVLVRQQPEPVYTPNLTVEGLQRLRAQGWLPRTNGAAQPADLLSARAALQTNVTSAAATEAHDGVHVLEAVRVTGTKQGGCTRYVPSAPTSPQLVLTTPAAGGRALLRSDVAGNLLVFISDSRTGAVGAPAVFALTVGQTYALDLVAATTRAIVTLPQGPTVVCSG